MRKLFFLVLMCLMIVGLYSQQVIFSSDFESDDTNAGWTILNHSTTENNWYHGTAAASSGSKGMYISNDGGVTNAYTIASGAGNYIYHDIDFPAGSPEYILLNLDMRVYGQTNTNNNCDYLRIYLLPEETAITARNASWTLSSDTYDPSSGTSYRLGERWYRFDTLPNGTDWHNITISIPLTHAGMTIPGSTYRLAFLWNCNTSTGEQPPAAIDNVSVMYYSAGNPPLPAVVSIPKPNATLVPTNITLRWTGNTFSNPATGYKVYLGTTNPPLLVQDVGNVLSYTPTARLANETTYYWQVVPYNASGDATQANCPIYSFTTIQAGLAFIGNGDVFSGYAPARFDLSWNMTETIYLQTELAAAGFTGGTITHIGYTAQYRSNSAILNTPFNMNDDHNQWLIYIGETTQSIFRTSASTPDTWIQLDDMELVFDGHVPNNPLVTGDLLLIELETPFTYSGDVGSNLVVYINEYGDGSSGNYNHSFFQGTNVGENRSIRGYISNSSLGAFIPKGNQEWGNGFNNNNNVNPNLTLRFVTASTAPDLSVSDFTVPPVVPGTEPMTVVVTNTGAIPAGTGDYTINIYREATPNNILLATYTGAEAIPEVTSGVFSTYTLSIPATGVGGYNNWLTWGLPLGETITLRAEVIFDTETDENPNNDSLPATTYLRPYTFDLKQTTVLSTGFYTGLPIHIVVENDGWETITPSDYKVEIFEILSDETSILVYTLEGGDLDPIPVCDSVSYDVTPDMLTPLSVSLPALLNLQVIVSRVGDDDGDDENNAVAREIYALTHAVAIGSGNRTLTYPPMIFSYRANMFQSIYTAADFAPNAFGYITHISFRARLVTVGNTPILPVNIYMANEPTGTGFVQGINGVAKPISEFTHVAVDYPLPLHLGEQYLWIELDEPFFYDGGDLYVMMTKYHVNHGNAVDNASSNQWYHTADEANWVSIFYQDYSATNPPYNDPYALTVSQYHSKPQMTFNLSMGNYGRVSGIVSDSEGVLSGVLVTDTGTGVTTTTNDAGEYSMMVDYTSVDDLVFTKDGYITLSEQIDSLGWDDGTGVFLATYSPTMSLAPTVTVSGVISFVDTGDGIASGITVHIGGYTGVTTDNGAYSVEDVLALATYEVSVDSDVTGYLPYIGTLTIGDETMGATVTHDIVINEAMRPPLYVHAVPTGEPNEVEVRWFDPYTTPAAQPFTLIADIGDDLSFGSGNYIAAHRYTPQDLLGFQEALLVKVSFRPNTVSTGFAVMIWTGDDLTTPDVENPTYMQSITQPLIAGEYNEVHLDIPVLLETGNELVIGFRSTGSQIRVRTSTALRDGYSNKYYYNGSWTTISSVLPIWVESWCIRGFAITPAAPNPHPTRAFDESYQVFRMLATESISDLGATDISSGGTYMSDLSITTTVPYPAIWRFAVRSIYNGTGYDGIDDGRVDAFAPSAPAYSPPVSMLEYVEVTVNVSTFDLSPVAGAVLTASPGGQTGTLVGGMTSYSFELSPNKPYTITVALAGYAPYQVQRPFMDDTIIDAVLVQLNAAYAWSFAGDPDPDLPTGWTNIDANGDNWWWRFANDTATDGRSMAFSESKCQDTNVCVYPDNWLISPALTFPANASAIDLYFSAAPSSGLRSQEKLFVYVTEDIAGATPTWSDFLVDLAPNNPNNGWANEELVVANGAERIRIIEFESGETSWQVFHEVLSGYAGSTIYIAFRHAHTENQEYLKLSDIYVTMDFPVQYTVSGTLLPAEAGANVVGLTVSLINTNPQGEPVADVTSGAGGLFSFTNAVYNGTYTLKVSRTGNDNVYTYGTAVTVDGADNTGLNITVPTYVSGGDVVEVPSATVLGANYPNPFNPTTTIAFDVARAGAVSISVYNIKGQLVRNLVNGDFTAGKHNVVWNGEDATGRSVGSGIYFYRMVAPGYTNVRKMVMMK